MYHFIGIKGSGMSALAQIMCELGYQVQGSDVEKHFFTHIKGISLVHRSSGRILPVDNNLAFTVRGEVIAILQDVNGFELSLANNDKYRITSTKLQGEELKVEAEEIKAAPTPIPTPIPTPAPTPGGEKKLSIRFNLDTFSNSSFFMDVPI